MTTVQCLIRHDGRLLMMRRPLRRNAPGMLLPLGGHVGTQETPVEACVREVREETGHDAAPRCVAVIFNVLPAHTTSYRFMFVADSQDGHVRAPRAPEQELVWVAIGELASRTDVPPIDRTLIPLLLSTAMPLIITLDMDTSIDPYLRRVRSIEPMFAAA